MDSHIYALAKLAAWGNEKAGRYERKQELGST